MKIRLSFLITFLFIAFFSFAQENCANGIDDDNDGFVDLNDTDCNCHTFSQIPSVIPNPSFELYNYCPSGFSEMSASQNWIQATYATSDYYNINNTCNFYPLNFPTQLYTIPDGNGFVGAHYIDDWKEYVGTSLPSTLHAGTTYEIEFNVAGSAFDFASGGFITLQPNAFSPTKITLYGCANGTNLPIHTTYSPNTADPTWVILGDVVYNPVTAWSTQVIRFTPAVNINAVILGPEPTLPPDYGSLMTAYPYAYFFYDNLKLNKSNDVTITSTGDYCSHTVVINSTIINPDPNVTYTYQWYNNGVAIVGATASTYAVATYNVTNSFAVSIFDGSNCILSNALNPSATQVNPPLTNPVTYCQNETAVPLTANGSSLLWYTNATGGVGSPIAITPSTANAGTFNYYVTQSCSGIESTRAVILVTINQRIAPNFLFDESICFESEVPVLTTTSPNGIPGTWNPAQVNANQTASYTFTPNPTACASPQTVTIQIIPPIDFTLEGGCRSHNYYIDAIAASGSFDLKSLQFTWTNSNNVVVGDNEPFLDVTGIVNSTIEEEQFPLTYGLTITDNNGCSFYEELGIDTVFCNIQKGISVNEDGDNDYFDLAGLQVNHLDIYNRYGMVVYSKDNYINEWKGQSNSGNDLPSATYFYYIQSNDPEVQTKTGWIYLLRQN